MSEERLEIIEKMAHSTGADALIAVCKEVRRLQAKVSAASGLIREIQRVQFRVDNFGFSGDV